MNTCFVALGFDPVPGHPDGVDAVARVVARAAGALEQVARDGAVLSEVEGWRGEAAQSFERSVHGLRGLDESAAALASVERTLRRWADELRLRQREAQRLERLATEAARATPETGDGPLREVRGRAVDLRNETQAAAAEVERTVRGASGSVPYALGWLERLGGVARLTTLQYRPQEIMAAVRDPENFVAEHADAIALVSDAAGAASAVLAFFPPTQPLALGLVGVNVLGTATLARYGYKSQTDVVMAAAGAAVGLAGAGAARTVVGNARHADPGSGQSVKLFADGVVVGLTVPSLAFRPVGPAQPGGSATPRRLRLPPSAGVVPAVHRAVPVPRAAPWPSSSPVMRGLPAPFSQATPTGPPARARTAVPRAAG